MKTHDQVLIALRQIIRAIDLHSKKLEREAGLTGPQLLIMQLIHDEGPLTSGVLAKSISLSQATVTSILDRLDKKGYLQRKRDQEDKRKIWLSLSEAGEHALEQAPALLQEGFVLSFSNLKDWEQSLILSSLQRVATMMQASDLEASPVLDTPHEHLVTPPQNEK